MDTDNKKCQISLVKTDKAQNCVIIDERNHMFFTELLLTQSYLSSLNMKSYHIYITSDDEIINGDWFYNLVRKEIQKCNSYLEELSLNKFPELAIKIIATTDVSLKYNEYTSVVDESNGIKENWKHQLPQPSKQFIEKYIEAWNSNNKIESVLVDYEPICRAIENDILVPKVDSHNYITITTIKNSWTKDEVIDILNSISPSKEIEGEFPDFDSKWNDVKKIEWGMQKAYRHDAEVIKRWIKENV